MSPSALFFSKQVIFYEIEPKNPLCIKKTTLVDCSLLSSALILTKNQIFPFSESELNKRE